jgi:AraC family transcriptional regulator
MPWNTERRQIQRKTLSLRNVSFQGIRFGFIEEDITAPTDWTFSEDHHVIVVHRAGTLESMESVFERGPSGHVLPKIGDIWVIPAQDRYAAIAKGNVVGFCEMVIPTALVGNRALDARIGHRDPMLHRLTERLATIADREDNLANLLRDSISETIRYHLSDDYALGAAKLRPKLAPKLSLAQKQALEVLIEDSLDMALTLAALAHRVSMTVSDFLRAFSEAFGLTPHQYVVRQRLKRGKDLLGATNEPVTAIAMALGFSTSSHFAATFKQHVGLSPSEYRAIIRK